MSPDTGEGSLARPLLSFLAWGLLVWLVFFVAWRLLPGTRPGHEQVYEAAIEAIEGGPLFPSDAEIRVAIFGDSQVQAGFVPSVFDAESDGRVASYNLGLPSTTTFVEQLELLALRDPPPTHVLITNMWKEVPVPAPSDRLMDDDWLMQKLFPFKDLPRNLFLFILRSLGRGGPAAFYRASIANVEQSLADRGYFFIEGMSRHPGHRLPDDFRLDADDPNATRRRDPPVEGTVSDRIRAAAERADLTIYLVPVMQRIGESAPSVRDPSTEAALREHGIRVLGPGYWLLPNRFFSDPMHLNPEGARCYTKLLWELVGPVLTAPPGADPPMTAPVRTRPSCS
jgi:hypothetical protein